MHDYGIKPTLPEMLAEIQAANDATKKKGWRGWSDDEPEERPNEYVGTILDNYLDLWSVKPKKYERGPLAPNDIPDGKSYFVSLLSKLRKVSDIELIKFGFPRFAGSNVPTHHFIIKI